VNAFLGVYQLCTNSPKAIPLMGRRAGLRTIRARSRTKKPRHQSMPEPVVIASSSALGSSSRASSARRMWHHLLSDLFRILLAAPAKKQQNIGITRTIRFHVPNSCSKGVYQACTRAPPSLPSAPWPLALMLNAPCQLVVSQFEFSSACLTRSNPSSQSLSSSRRA
jgi:hypothetical protein